MAESAHHQEELVYTTTEDELLLEGVIVRPKGVPIRPLSFVWIHGNAARFYDYGYVAICRVLAEAGYACVSGNTRGHDIAAFVWRGTGGRPTQWRGSQDMPTGAGAGWEDLAEAPRDVAAWVQVGAGLASDGVILVGHSSGAQRVLLHQPERQDGRVRGVALASPDVHGFLAPGDLESAERLVAEGRGMEVLPAQPFAAFYRQSAASVVRRAAVVARLHATDLAALRGPLLAFFGEREPGAERTFDILRREATGVRRLDTRIIADADHVYAGREAEVAGVLAEWTATFTRSA
jgi:pimeloyl-ACP methyl ester carboxylesterase